MRNLEQIRPDIDQVDRQLKELFLKRMELVHEVGEYKLANGLPVKNYEREEALIADKINGIHSFQRETKAFFRNLIDVSCSYQEQMMDGHKIELPEFKEIPSDVFFQNIQSVCFQGIPGSYSHEVCGKLFPHADLCQVDSFRDVFDQVEQGSCAAGVIPIENITAGAVTEVYEALNEKNLYIAASPILPISHFLMGTGKREEVEKVTSHPQALSQCSSFIRKHKLKRITAANTAVAAKQVKEANDPALAAIASKTAADLYGLTVLEQNIADTRNNKTRFIVITRQPFLLADADTISMIFSIPHRVGALSTVLQEFAREGLNLSMIESMPLKGGKWEYLFYVDVKGSLGSPDLKDTLKNLGSLFDYFKLTGNYKTIDL